MDINIKKELKEIEKDEAKIARKKQRLLEKEEEFREMDNNLERLYQESGFNAPKKLIEALAVKYDVKIGSSTSSTGSKKPRKNTRMTPELRDEIKREFENGKSVNAVASDKGISNAVVKKVKEAKYDHL